MAVQERAAETRRRLVAAAVGLFADDGYLETTPKDIARAAELTTGAFYYHFTSKEEIAAAIVAEARLSGGPAPSDETVPPGSGLERVITTEFATVDALNRDPLRWIGFHLGMAIGHLGPAARRTYRERVEAFSLAVSRAVQPHELRDDVSAEQAAELLWVASTGAQLMSDALDDRSPAALFDRLGIAWKSALRRITPEAAFPRLEALVDETAARYGRMDPAQPAPASGRVA